MDNALTDYPILEEEKTYTLEEYLALEETSEYKNEYEGGKIRSMAGGTLRHGRLAASAVSVLHGVARQKKNGCQVMDSTAKIFAAGYDSAMYPDAVVICGKLQTHAGKNQMITNPTLVVEVLSKSTENYDRGRKFLKYRSLPGFREYLLISQYEPLVECWYRVEENLWRITTVQGLEGSIRLETLDTEVPMADIYYQVDFSEEAPEE